MIGKVVVMEPNDDQPVTRLTTRGRSHTLPRSVASEADYERVQARCSCDSQLLAATQV